MTHHMTRISVRKRPPRMDSLKIELLCRMLEVGIAVHRIAYAFQITSNESVYNFYARQRGIQFSQTPYAQRKPRAPQSPAPNSGAPTLPKGTQS